MKYILNYLLLGIMIATLTGCNISKESAEPEQDEASEIAASVLEAEPEYEEITTDIDTSDWITYRNEEYGFEVKYPPNWEWDDASYDDNFVLNFGEIGQEYWMEGTKVPVISLGIRKQNHEAELDDLLSEMSKRGNMYVEKKDSYDLFINETSSWKIVNTLRNGYIYTLHWGAVSVSNPPGDDQLFIYNSILNSFNFTNQN